MSDAEAEVERLHGIIARNNEKSMAMRDELIRTRGERDALQRQVSEMRAQANDPLAQFSRMFPGGFGGRK